MTEDEKKLRQDEVLKYLRQLCRAMYKAACEDLSYCQGRYAGAREVLAALGYRVGFDETTLLPVALVPPERVEDGK